MAVASNAETQFRDLGKDPYPFKLLVGDRHDLPSMPEPDQILAAIGIELSVDRHRFLAGSAHLYKLVDDPDAMPDTTRAVVAAHAEISEQSGENPIPAGLKSFMNRAVPPTVGNRLGREDSHLIGGLVIYEGTEDTESALFASSRFLAELKGEAHKFVAAARNGRYLHGLGRSEVEAINRDHLKVTDPRHLQVNMLAGIGNLIAVSLPDQVSLRRTLNELTDDGPSTVQRREAS